MKQQMTIYYTSDIHGYLFSTTYADREEKNMGLLKCLPNFEKDGNTLLIDGGDMLQGSALATYCQAHPEENFPQATVLNQAKYDFVTIGNHDVNYGTDYLFDYLSALDATCLCENILDKKEQSTKFPWTIKVLENGLKVGIVGIVTDYINVWEKAENIQDIVIDSPFDQAKKALEEMQSQVDVTLCIYHGGFERDIKTGEPLSKTSENIGYKICQELAFDVLLTGHQHLLIEGELINGTYVVQPSANGLNYIKLILEKEQNKVTVRSEVGEPNQKADPFLCQKFASLEEKVQAWLDQPIGQLKEEMLASDKLTIGLKGHPMIEVIGAAQLAASGAQITVVSLANTAVGFHQKVTMRDVLATYPYTNQLITLTITGKQLKEVVEKNADYFDLDKEGKIVLSPAYLYPKVEHYHYDFFIGISYIIDLSKEVGQRLTQVSYQGKPIQDTDQLTISLSDYRASGGGNFPTYKKCPVLDEGAQEIVQLIIDYIQNNAESPFLSRLDYCIKP